MPVLAFFGGADDSIPQDTVAAFDRALTEAGVTHEVEVYPGAAHAFANPSGERYDADGRRGRLDADDRVFRRPPPH